MSDIEESKVVYRRGEGSEEKVTMPLEVMFKSLLADYKKVIQKFNEQARFLKRVRTVIESKDAEIARLKEIAKQVKAISAQERSQAEKNRRLDEHYQQVIKKLKAKHQRECENLCIHAEECKSFFPQYEYKRYEEENVNDSRD